MFLKHPFQTVIDNDLCQLSTIYKANLQASTCALFFYIALHVCGKISGCDQPTVDYEVRQALLGHRMPGMTASYSHGGPAWDQKLRDAVTKLDSAFTMSYGLSYERPAVAVGDPNLLKNGEPAGTRTQGPRLKSSKRLISSMA